jgi:hypothetical protein
MMSTARARRRETPTRSAVRQLEAMVWLAVATDQTYPHSVTLIACIWGGVGGPVAHSLGGGRLGGCGFARGRHCARSRVNEYYAHSRTRVSRFGDDSCCVSEQGDLDDDRADNGSRRFRRATTCYADVALRRSSQWHRALHVQDVGLC